MDSRKCLPCKQHCFIYFQDPQNPTRNRGFAFVLYYNNACADYSRQKMSNAKFKLDGNTPTVTWADPKSAPDHSAASQVNLLMSNNTNSLTLKMLKEMLFPCFTSVLHSS